MTYPKPTTTHRSFPQEISQAERASSASSSERTAKLNEVQPPININYPKVKIFGHTEQATVGSLYQLMHYTALTIIANTKTTRHWNELTSFFLRTLEIYALRRHLNTLRRQYGDPYQQKEHTLKEIYHRQEHLEQTITQSMKEINYLYKEDYVRPDKESKLTPI